MGTSTSKIIDSKETKKVGNAVVTVGKVYSNIKAVIATVFFLIFLITSIVLLTRPSKKYIKVPGTVQSIPGITLCNSRVSTHTITNKDKTSDLTTSTVYDCTFNLEYTPNGLQTQTQKITTDSSIKYNNKEKINVYYDENNNSKVYLYYPPNTAHIIGGIFAVFTIITLFTMIFLWINVYIVNNSKLIAGVEGTGAVSGLAIGAAKNVIGML